MTENKNDRSATDFASVEDPLNMNRTASNETVVLSEVSNIILLAKMILLYWGRKPVSILSDEFCDELTVPHLFSRSKFDFNTCRDILLSSAR